MTPASPVAAGSAVAVVVPVALTVSGATLVVRAVEASAHGTVWVLERASDGARTTVQFAGQASAVVTLPSDRAPEWLALSDADFAALPAHGDASGASATTALAGRRAQRSTP